MVTLLITLFFLSGCKEERAKVGEKAPSLAVFDAQEKAITFDTYEGKPIVLEFWSVTCGSCLAMMKEWEELTQTRPNDVAVIGINIDKKTFELQTFANEQGFTFPLGFDQLGITQERYMVSVTPTTFFINRDRTITKMHVGFSNNMNVNQYIDELLKN